MCGIVGYVGRKEAAPVLIEGLRRLEYRGRDSAGICTLADGALQVRKQVGRVEGLAHSLKVKPLSGSLGISHKHDQTHQRPSGRRHKQQSLTVAPNLALCRACGT
jgi:glucosamine--fructose-6-phosphate aminotransferase (isomerizing)